MRVGQWMTKDPQVVGPKETIVVARAIMRQRGIRRLPVVEGEHLIGIVTDRDLRSAWASDATTLTAQELHYLLERIPVRDVMTSPVITVRPETLMEEAVRLMREKKIGGLPVLRDARLVGILTEADVFRAFAQVLHAGNLEGRVDLKAPAPAAGKVLVPVLGTSLSGKAVREACLLAGDFGVRPKVLLVMDNALHVEDLRTGGDTRALDEIVGGLLADYRNIAESMGVEIEVGFRSGDPATVALEEIVNGDYDFAVLARRNPLHLVSSRLELEKIGFAAKVMEASAIPVLVVGEAAQV